MNRAAEQAAPKAKDIFVGAVKKMTITDAKNILYGKNDNGATLFFEKHTRPSLFTLFFPVMKSALDKVGATKAYKYLLDQYNALPLVEKSRTIWTRTRRTSPGRSFFHDFPGRGPHTQGPGGAGYGVAEESV